MPRGNIVAGALALPAFLILGFAADSNAPPKVPLGLPAFEWPEDNNYSAAKAELGRYLYFDRRNFDRRLSADDSVSRGSCHQPEHGFTDGAPVSTGIKALPSTEPPKPYGNLTTV